MAAAHARLCSFRHLCQPTYGSSAKKLSKCLSKQPVPARYSSYRSSPIEGSPDLYTNVVISKSADEWKFVERLLPPKVVPQPISKQNYISGWKPPSESAKGHPYFVERTKNYMLPVYLQLSYRGMRRITQVRRIQGDVWKLEQDLKTFLERKINNRVASQVHEVNGHVNFKGDYVNHVKEWVLEKGF